MKIGVFLLTLSILTLCLEADSKGADDYGMAGCGLGSIVLGSQNNFLQVSAATTNGTFYSQISGITSGTSNCTADGIVKKERTREIFVHMNYESLEQEIAVGKGEKLETLATLFGCSQNKDKFNSMTKSNFKKLFSSQKTPLTIVSTIANEINKNEILKSSCKI
jgi:hypothetical protein